MTIENNSTFKIIVMNTAEQIKNHIAKGESDKAIKLLLEFTKSEMPDAHDEALLLSGQYRQWKREITLGIQQSNSELRRIEVGVMDIVNHPENYSEASPRLSITANKFTATSPKKSNLMSILLGVFGTISVGFVLLMMLGGEESTPAQPLVTNAEAVPAIEMEQSQERNLESGLKESDFNQMMASINAGKGNEQSVEEFRLDINTVIQVIYSSNNEGGAFEKVNNSQEWIERGNSSNDIVYRYVEISRENNTIVLYDDTDDRTIYIAAEKDRIYETIGSGEKEYIFDIIGLY